MSVELKFWTANTQIYNTDSFYLYLFEEKIKVFLLFLNFIQKIYIIYSSRKK